jgi:hypothetical protein
MRPRTLTLTGSGSGTTNTDALRLNWRAPGYTFGFSTDGSTTGFTVQITTTSPEGYASLAAWTAAASWTNVTDMAVVTAAIDQAIISSVHGVRLQANENGTDTGVLNVIERED